MTSYVFGWIATSFSLVYKLPQIYMLCRTKKHEGLSLASLVCQACAYGFYIAHGCFIEDWPILVMAVISCLQSGCLIVLFFRYRT